jgi:tRNA(fMet)-specific endonuclease VapC
MYILDSDILALLHAGHDGIGRRREDIDPAEVVTTILTKAEILRARCEFLLKATDADQRLRAQYWLQQSEDLLRSLRIRLLDRPAIVEFQRLRALKGLKKIGATDLLIAAMALANHATLVSRNVRHFRSIPGLKLENWADSA